MRPVKMVPTMPAMFAGIVPAVSVSIAIASAPSPMMISSLIRSARTVPIISRLLVLSCPAV